MSLGISFGSFTCIILVPVGTLLSCLWLKLIWLGCRATVVYVYILDIPHRSALQSMLIMVEYVIWRELNALIYSSILPFRWSLHASMVYAVVYTAN